MVDDERAGADLPWGWWLRRHGSVVEDENGRTYRTIRDAFFFRRLHFPVTHVAREQHELLLRVLTAINSRWLGPVENKHDLFEGNMLLWRFYQCWLASVGLLETSDRLGRPLDPLHAPLNAEGRSVMLMLQATRDPEWEYLPISEVIDVVRACGHSPADDEREAALRAFEQSIGRRRHVFAREKVGRSHVITLTGMPMGPGVRMPTFRVSWSMTFNDVAVRNDLFAWLTARVHRWDDWGEIAHRKGADALTQHLLGLVVASQAPGELA